MSATWISLQSVIQLGVAVNAAMFSVAALRGPLVARERNATDTLLRLHGRLLGNATVTADPQWKSFHSLAIRMRGAFAESERSIEHWDKWIQVIAGVAAAASMVALVMSAYFQETAVELFGVAVLVGLTVLPSLLAIIFNAYFVRRKLEAVKRLRTEADPYLVDLVKKDGANRA